MPGQHQVEQPRRQRAAYAQTEPRTEPGFFLRMGWGSVSVARDLRSFRPPLVEQSRHLRFESHLDDAALLDSTSRSAGWHRVRTRRVSNAISRWGGYSVAGWLARSGESSAGWRTSLFAKAFATPAQKAACRSSFSCFSVRPAILANLSVEAGQRREC